MAVETMRRLADEAVRRTRSSRSPSSTAPAASRSASRASWSRASAPHRQEAFEGARFLLDQVKANAPIWKREHPEEGEPRWVEGNLPKP